MRRKASSMYNSWEGSTWARSVLHDAIAPSRGEDSHHICVEQQQTDLAAPDCSAVDHLQRNNEFAAVNSKLDVGLIVGIVRIWRNQIRRGATHSDEEVNLRCV
jgi:hypothetical protein